MLKMLRVRGSEDETQYPKTRQPKLKYEYNNIRMIDTIGMLVYHQHSVISFILI